MSFIDTLSGEPAKEPVVTPNGDIYERSLLIKHIETQGTDPITNEPLSIESIVPLKATNSTVIKPRSMEHTSIPQMLQTLQNEWDALMLETFTLKKQLDTSREELSHALYQNDAACRVIARLMKERDEARKELEDIKANGGSMKGVSAASATPGLDNEAHTRLKTKADELSQNRKTRTIPSTLASIDQVKSVKSISSHPIHKTTSPGILALDIHPNNPDLIVTGGVDHCAVLFDRKSGKKLSTLSGHTKRVNSVLFAAEHQAVVTGSQDQSVRVWQQQGAGSHSLVHTLTSHSGEVTQIALHPTGHYVLSSSLDHSWAFHDIARGRTLLHVRDPEEATLTCTKVHPDGLIFATGTGSNLVRVWDIKSSKTMATFTGHKAAITALCFSENGYYLATAAKDNQIKLWDLRGPKNIKTLQLDNSVTALNYDYTGTYLAAATGNDIRVFTGKALDHVVTLHEHTADVTDVKWGPDARFLASTSMDRTLRFWA